MPDNVKTLDQLLTLFSGNINESRGTQTQAYRDIIVSLVLQDVNGNVVVSGDISADSRDVHRYGMCYTRRTG